MTSQMVPVQRRIAKLTSYGVVLVTLLSVMACVPSKVTVKESPYFRPSSIRSLAVLPLRPLATPQRRAVGTPGTTMAPTEIRSQFRLPGATTSGGSSDPLAVSRVPQSATKRITRLVYDALQHRLAIRLVPPHAVQSAVTNYRAAHASASWNEQVKGVAEQLDVDAVIVGLVRTYRQRIGTRIGATPAEVGFEIHLIDPKRSTVLWTGEYYEEQKPLNQDLVGFVERKGAFVTAEELAEYGVHQVMKEFPLAVD